MKTGLMLSSLALAAGAGALLRSQYERNHFVTEETVIYSSKIKQRRTLVFLSDLHNKEFGKSNQELVGCIRDIGPDGVLIGGDMIVAKKGNTSLFVVEDLLRALRSISPVYYGNGNHEQRIQQDRETYGRMYDEFRSMLQQTGIAYLFDRSVEVGEDLCISGLNIAPAYYKDVCPAKMQADYVYQHLGHPNPKRFQILLAHSPLAFSAYEQWGADLALAGHFHGGTIRIPLFGGVMTPQYQFFLPWCAGTFWENSSCMIVSRGLGTHSVNIRLNNKPQVVVIRLEPPTKA